MTAAVDRMAGRLTVPFGSGADRLGLVLTPGAAAADALVTSYDFAEHIARFETDPDPRYVLTARQDIPTATTITVGYEVLAQAGPATAASAELLVPAGTLAGMSAMLHLGANEGPAARLLTLTVDPPPATGTAADQWNITALLGNLAKLLWVVGAERDSLSSHLDQIPGQRSISEAVGPTLDLIGYDLGVPRFPPLPYAFEDGTVALYHLEEPAGVPVADAMTLYGGPGHPSVSVTALPGAVGRFGRGFSFTDPAAVIVIADHPELGADATTSFTAECFVKPGNGTWEGAVLSKHPDPADPARAGWALSVGEFGRGIPRSASFLVSDGPHAVPLFADSTLTTARFTHLAGVIDRGNQQARLYLDGTVVAFASLAAMTGAPANTEPVRIGRAGSGPATTFTGTIDEVRLSRAARTAFHPVLGEDDDGYRRRLRIFRRWTLPTPQGLQDALNDVVDNIHGVTQPLVVQDANATLVEGSFPVTLVPSDLATGESIDDLGRRGVTEAEASGTAADDDGFDPALLADASDARADFNPLPGVAAPVLPPRLRVGARRVLRALLDLLQAQSVSSGLQVRAWYDPSAPDLRQVGRAVILTHSDPSVPPGRLAALAQQAGFSFVLHRRDQDDVYASVRSTDTVEIIVKPGGGTATAENGFDLLTGQTLALDVDPALPLGAVLRWATIACGEGRADLPDRTDQPELVITAARPGDLITEVTVTTQARSFSAAARFRIGIQELAAGQSISDAGALGVDPSVAAGSDGAFDPSYLVDNFADPRVTFAAGANTRRMQRVVAARLAALLGLISAGEPTVTSAWDPAGTGPQAVGRALTLEQGTSADSLARLGALAHAAGFSYVENDGTLLRLAQAPGELITIAGPDTLAEGGSAPLSLLPRAVPRGAALAGTKLWTANSGTGTVSAIDTATGQVSACVKVGLGPDAVAAAPDGSHVYTADAGGTTVTAVATAGPSVAGTAELLESPVDLAHHPTAATVYAALGPAGKVAEVDAATLTVTRTVDLGAAVQAVSVEPGGARLWVATAGSALRLVDTGTFVAGPTVALAGPPADIVVGAARAYVTVPSARALQVVDVTTTAVEATFTDLGQSPQRLALSPAGAVLYVTDDEERVYLRQADGSAQGLPGLPASAPVGGTPAGVVADDHRAYVTAGGTAADNVSVLDADAEAALAAVWPLGTGLGERLVWTLRAAGAAQAQLSSTTTPVITLTAQAPGPLLVRAVYQWPDHTPPYTFQVVLNAQLTAAEQGGTQVIIRKDQYDLIMNTLNQLHPVGVEVDTRIVREHVLELRDSLLDAFPPYTYPDFRARVPRPAIVPIGLDP